MGDKRVGGAAALDDRVGLVTMTEQPQDRTASWVGSHEAYSPQELAGGRS